MQQSPSFRVPPRRLRLAGRRLAGPALASPRIAQARAGLERLDLEGSTRRICGIAREEGLPPLLPLAVALAETGLRNVDAPGNPGRGWFQMRIDAPPYLTSERPPTDAEAHDLAYAATEFSRAAARLAHMDPPLRRDLWLWAVRTQGVEHALHRNRPFAPRNFASFLFEATGLLEAFDR